MDKQVEERRGRALREARAGPASQSLFGRTRIAASKGSRGIAPSMFTRNMKVSMMPMSAWNFSGENREHHC
jgi:hypothetical protein